jgi:outer membrane receptor for ferrienterochelin and colicin
MEKPGEPEEQMKRITIAVAGILAAMLIPCMLRAQQTGTLSGTVLDAATGEPVIRATVVIIGTRLGAYTNTSGAYVIRNVPVGTYSIKVTNIGYAAHEVTGITVEAGKTVGQDVSLTEQTISKDTVRVTARANRQSESSALVERKRSVTVSDAISAEQIARVPASDAGDAMKRVTGVSVVGGKYVVVRGLAERYSATQLNGVNLPSPEPEKKVVPFDIFPSSMISRLTTVKTFTPDNPGDFAGGLVKISTKDYPESFLFNASASTGFDTETQGADALAYAGGGTDYLGIDDGTRGLPAGVSPGRRTTTEEQASLLGRFRNNVFTPRTTSLPVNQSYNLSIGNQFDIGFPLGFLISGSYANSSTYRVTSESYPLLSETNGQHDLRYDYTTRRAERSTLWGGLFSLTVQPSPEHKLSIKAIYNHTSDDESRIAEGFYNQSTTGDIRSTRLRFLERSIASAQLEGEHKLEGFLNSKVDWRAAISAANRYEPDNRSTTYFRWSDGIYRFANNFGSNNGRFFSDLNDNESNVGLDWTIPFATWSDVQARLKLGGLVRSRSREFSARRFIYGTETSDPAALALAPEELFTPEKIRAGFITFNDETQKTDNYSAEESITAGYAMVDLPIAGPLRMIAGARFERWDLDLEPINLFTGLRDTALAAHRDVSDILPSVNFIYSIGDAMNVRASFSQTLARPEFRELAPFRFDDYRQSTYGNPSLERTKIMNYDLRWEWFPRAGEVVAVSTFYKSFTNPIEQFYLVGGSDVAVESANANTAVSYGAEFEVRRALDFVTEALSEFSVGANLTLVKSEVTFTEGELVKIFDGVSVNDYSSQTLTSTSRPLQGQSPYVINASIGYDNYDWGTSATLLYNIFGERLSIVGTNRIPDAYEQPRGSLDLTIAQRLPSGLQLKLTGRNLLNEDYLLHQEFANGEKVETERYSLGRSLTLGIAYSFD